MKKTLNRALALALACFLIISVLPVPAGADSTGVCFTAVDDHLCELSRSPVVSNGTYYVSARVFADCGIYYSYFAASETAQLYTSSKYVFFDIANGTSYDENYNYFSAVAFLRNGIAYVPVSWVCSYFGLSCSYIAGKGSGDILRIQTGAAYLNDTQFLSAATSLMQSRYNEAYGSQNTGDSDSGNGNRSNTIVTVSFLGLPGEHTLDTLSRYGYKGCFFLTIEAASENAPLIRQIVASGHSVGIYCTQNPLNTVPAAQDSVFSAAQTLPTLLYSISAVSDECKSFAKKNAMAYFSPDCFITYDSKSANQAINELERSSSDFNILIESAADSDSFLASLLSHLKSSEYTVTALRETLF